MFLEGVVALTWDEQQERSRARVDYCNALRRGCRIAQSKRKADRRRLRAGEAHAAQQRDHPCRRSRGDGASRGNGIPVTEAVADVR